LTARVMRRACFVRGSITRGFFCAAKPGIFQLTVQISILVLSLA